MRVNIIFRWKLRYWLFYLERNVIFIMLTNNFIFKTALSFFTYTGIQWKQHPAESDHWSVRYKDIFKNKTGVLNCCRFAKDSESFMKISDIHTAACIYWEQLLSDDSCVLSRQQDQGSTPKVFHTVKLSKILKRDETMGISVTSSSINSNI